MSRDPDIDVARRALAALDLEGDPLRFSALFDPHDVEIVPLRAALEDTVYRGPNAPREFVEAAREAWARLTFEELEARRVGDRVLVVADVRARSRDAGLDLDFRIGAVFRLRDGRITHVHTYLDPDEAVAAAEAAAP